MWNNTGTQWWSRTSAFFEIAISIELFSSFVVLPTIRNLKALGDPPFKTLSFYDMTVSICFLSEVMEGTF